MIPLNEPSSNAPVDNHQPWQHSHLFASPNASAEHGIRLVFWFTGVMMLLSHRGLVFQLHGPAGRWLAHDFPCGGHRVCAFVYAAARRYAHVPHFAFGAWKMEVLGGFASSLFLLLLVVLMVVGSVEQFFMPEPILQVEGGAHVHGGGLNARVSIEPAHLLYTRAELAAAHPPELHLQPHRASHHG